MVQSTHAESSQAKPIADSAASNKGNIAQCTAQASEADIPARSSTRTELALDCSISLHPHPSHSVCSLFARIDIAIYPYDSFDISRRARPGIGQNKRLKRKTTCALRKVRTLLRAQVTVGVAPRNSRVARPNLPSCAFRAKIGDFWIRQWVGREKDNRERKALGEALRQTAESIPLPEEESMAIRLLLLVQRRSAQPGRYDRLLRSVLFRGNASGLA
jgi:hypothetical protein